MQLLSLSLLSLTVISVSGDCDDVANDHPEGCHDSPNIAKIVCLGTGRCVCKDGDSGEANPCTDIIQPNVLFEVTADEMDGEKCREICEASKVGHGNSSKCEYFRWEEDTTPSGGAVSEHCTLMQTGQCLVYSPCEGEHCQSGQAGCPSEGDTEPGGSSCKAGAVWGADRHAVHWDCVNPFDQEGNHIDIYGHDDIPSGTVCFTVNRCSIFDDNNDDGDPDTAQPMNELMYRNLVVQCNDNTAEPPITSGNWVRHPQSNNNVTQWVTEDNPNKLKDPICNIEPEDLVLDETKLHESGVAFICSKQDQEHFIFTTNKVVVRKQNSCALLCNFHHVLTIRPKVQQDGTSKWWLFRSGVGGGGEEVLGKGSNIGTNVYCWSAVTESSETSKQLDDHLSKEDLVTHDTTLHKNSSISEEGPASAGGSVPEDSPVSEDSPSSDNQVPKDGPVSKDSQVSKDVPVSDDDTLSDEGSRSDDGSFSDARLDKVLVGF